jgi:RHS repeat-associated protein
VYDNGSHVETRRYHLANGQKIAQRINQAGSDALSYVHADHLGSSVKLTDESGQVIQTIAYDPYGESVLSEGAEEPAYQYTGQEKDAETGLYYYGARYYDAELGRFIQADVLLDGLNRYAYGHNNPVKYVDPTGNYVVASDTGECFGGDCDHYPGYKDFDPKTLGDNDEDGNGIDDDVDLYLRVTSGILGESGGIYHFDDISISEEFFGCIGCRTSTGYYIESLLKSSYGISLEYGPSFGAGFTDVEIALIFGVISDYSHLLGGAEAFKKNVALTTIRMDWTTPDGISFNAFYDSLDRSITLPPQWYIGAEVMLPEGFGMSLIQPNHSTFA